MSRHEKEPKASPGETRAALGEISDGTKKRFLDFVETRVKAVKGKETSESNPWERKYKVDSSGQLLPASSITYYFMKDGKAPGEERRGTIRIGMESLVEPRPHHNNTEEDVVSFGISDSGSPFVDVAGSLNDPEGDGAFNKYMDVIETMEQQGFITPAT